MDAQNRRPKPTPKWNKRPKQTPISPEFWTGLALMSWYRLRYVWDFPAINKAPSHLAFWLMGIYTYCKSRFYLRAPCPTLGSQFYGMPTENVFHPHQLKCFIPSLFLTEPQREWEQKAIKVSKGSQRWLTERASTLNQKRSESTVSFEFSVLLFIVAEMFRLSRNDQLHILQHLHKFSMIGRC